MTGSAVFLPELVDLTRRCRMARNALSHGGLLVAVLENNSMSLPAFPAERFSTECGYTSDLRTLLHSPKAQLFCFQSIPHSLANTLRGVEAPRPRAAKKYRLWGKQKGWCGRTIRGSCEHS